MTRENYIKGKTETLLENDALGVETKELRYKEIRTLMSSKPKLLILWLLLVTLESIQSNASNHLR